MLSRPNLKRTIEERFGTVHKFCQANPQLSRSTVYQVVNGTYPGNQRQHAAKIMDAVTNRQMDDKVFTAIKGAACSRCTSKGDCAWCDEVFQAQTRAALKILNLTD